MGGDDAAHRLLKKPAMDSLDVSMTDHDMLDEMSLTVDLIMAANLSPGRMPQADIDRCLGLGCAPDVSRSDRLTVD